MIEGGPGDDFIDAFNADFADNPSTTIVFTADAGHDVVDAEEGDVIWFKDLAPADLEITLADLNPANIFEFRPVLFEVEDVSLYAPDGLPAPFGGGVGVSFAFGEDPDDPEWTLHDVFDAIDNLVEGEDDIPEGTATPWTGSTRSGR